MSSERGMQHHRPASYESELWIEFSAFEGQVGLNWSAPMSIPKFAPMFRHTQNSIGSKSKLGSDRLAQLLIRASSVVDNNHIWSWKRNKSRETILVELNFSFAPSQVHNTWQAGYWYVPSVSVLGKYSSSPSSACSLMDHSFWHWWDPSLHAWTILGKPLLPVALCPSLSMKKPQDNIIKKCGHQHMQECPTSCLWTSVAHLGE